MTIDRVNFASTSEGGDNVTGALVKLDQNCADLDAAIGASNENVAGIDERVEAVETTIGTLGDAATKDVGNVAGTVAAGNDGRFSDLDTRVTAAQTKADAALPKAGGTVTGSIIVAGTTSKMGALGLNIPGSGAPSGPLDVRTGNGGFVFRTNGSESVIDGVSNDNSAYGPFNCTGTVFSYYSRSGDGRLLARITSGTMSLDSVNGANSAFKAMAFTSLGFTFSGSVQVNGNITATGSITPSDERLKENIVSRAVLRGMALSLANAFAEWDLISNGEHQTGVVAQVAQGICPIYVFEFDYRPPPTFEEGTTNVTYAPAVKRLGVDKLGMALEASMDNALAIEELKQALAEAVARIAVLEQGLT